MVWSYIIDTRTSVTTKKDSTNSTPCSEIKECLETFSFTYRTAKKKQVIYCQISNKKSATSYKKVCCGFLKYLGWESNPHFQRNWILNPARLPIPPPRHRVAKIVNYFSL